MKYYTFEPFITHLCKYNAAYICYIGNILLRQPLLQTLWHMLPLQDITLHAVDTVYEALQSVEFRWPQRYGTDLDITGLESIVRQIQYIIDIINGTNLNTAQPSLPAEAELVHHYEQTELPFRNHGDISEQALLINGVLQHTLQLKELQNKITSCLRPKYSRDPITAILPLSCVCIEQDPNRRTHYRVHFTWCIIRKKRFALNTVYLRLAEKLIYTTAQLTIATLETLL